ncbi:MAG TPA: hypothetical protein VIT68_03325 [Candidatus Gracilibacteria bacterium]
MIDFLDYIVNHSWDILRLSTSFMVLGLGLFFLYICRVIYHATRLIKKVNSVLDNFNHYIRKPVLVLLTAHKFITKLFRIFGIGKNE